MAKDYTAIRQVLSATAVVLSLLFVGVQIRQNTVAQRAQTRQALADASREFILDVVASPELWNAWVGRWRFVSGQHREVDTQLSQADSAKAEVAIMALLRNAENVFLQYREGAIDESALATYGFSGGIWDGPEVRAWWLTQRARWDSSFVRAFEEANAMR
jgi:hypothetical protein